MLTTGRDVLFFQRSPKRQTGSLHLHTGHIPIAAQSCASQSRRMLPSLGWFIERKQKIKVVKNHYLTPPHTHKIIKKKKTKKPWDILLEELSALATRILFYFSIVMMCFLPEFYKQQGEPHADTAREQQQMQMLSPVKIWIRLWRLYPGSQSQALPCPTLSARSTTTRIVPSFRTPRSPRPLPHPCVSPFKDAS